MRNKHYTDEQIAYIKSIALGKTSQEITDMLNQKYNDNRTMRSVRSLMSRNGIQNKMQGCNTHFKQGGKPWNKGMKGMPGYSTGCKATQFKVGHIPYTHLPIGSEVEREGILLVKTAEPNVWMRKHIMVWEMHNGPVPEGYVVSFKDLDKTNCVIDNLFLVSRGALTSVARRGMRAEHPEINYSIHLLTELELAIKRKG